MPFIDCFSLGHAGWLFEVAGLRLLVDPLLFRGHHRGVFEVTPPRELVASALRPDFVLISHAHRDHFDLPSLDALARLDPSVTVFSADERVCRAARALGFDEVHAVEAGRVIELDGARLVTTPSAGEREWGLLIEHQGAAVWHLVDTTLTPAQVRRLRADMAARLGLASLAGRGPDLSLARFQPLLEVAAAVGEAGRFPAREYGRLLDVAAALGSGAVVASSCASIHAAPFDAMNRAVYPQTERRFLRDLAARAPDLRPLACGPGAAFRVRPGAVEALAPAASMLDPLPRERDTTFRPDLPPAPPGPWPGEREDEAVIDRWVRGPLREGLRPLEGDARLALVVRGAGGERWYSLWRGEVATTFDGDYDLLNAVDGAALTAVIEGRLAWADVLLAGLLRASDRRYEVSEGGLRPGDGDLLFVYRGLSYDESEQRASQHEIDGLLARR